MSHKYFILFLVASVLSAAASDHREWSYNLALYEVNVRQYTPEGTFAAFSEHLDRLQSMGVGILWFMPIHPIGVKNRLGRLGSYYAVRDYRDVNPEFGTLEDFKALVQEIHSRGMFVLIDWVANHTAWDNVLTEEHPEWYVLDPLGQFIAPPGTNWSDVIELDYSQDALRTYMIETMKWWALDADIDGFRCDAVDMMPRDFWRTAVAQLKAAKPSLFFLAEADNKEWHDLGFDMTYGWGLYGFGGGVLKRIASGSSTAADLHTYLNGEKSRYAGAYRMYFTSNHDENSWQGTPTELFGDAARLFSILTAVIPGMPLIYSGEEAGLQKRLRFFDKDEIEWREHKNADLYTRLLHLKKRNRALWNGDRGAPYQRITSTDDRRVLAFFRQKENDAVLMIANLTPEERSFSLKGTLHLGLYRDVLGDTLVTLSENQALTLPAWGGLVLERISGDVGVRQQEDDRRPTIFPNPANAGVLFRIEGIGQVVITDARGRRLRLLCGGPLLQWNGCDEEGRAASSGVYFYRLSFSGRTLQGKFTLLR